MIVTTDDLCLSYLENFRYFDALKEKYPQLQVIVFTIGNYKNEELLLESSIFKNWFEAHKNWVEIAVHSYDHQYPPDGNRENEEHWIALALNSLKSFLPEKYGYRSAGWQTTSNTVPILKKLGFSYIAYEDKIKDLNNGRISENQVLNSHLYDINSILKIGGMLDEVFKNYDFTKSR